MSSLINCCEVIYEDADVSKLTKMRGNHFYEEGFERSAEIRRVLTEVLEISFLAHSALPRMRFIRLS
jgi:hypothetical protein